MSETAPPAEGFYYVHACSSRHTDYDEWHGCNGVYIWAPDASTAKFLSQKVDDEPPLTAEREPGLDAHRAKIGDRLSPWKKHTPDEARALRAIGWTEDEDHRCSTCGDGEYDILPESQVCWSCSECAGCREADSECEECKP